MAKAAATFSEVLDTVIFRDASVPVLSNSEPSPCISGVELKGRLQQQMNRGVRWRETMATMVGMEIDTLVEIGPGNVLSGLARRSMKTVTTAQIAGAGDLGQ